MMTNHIRAREDIWGLEIMRTNWIKAEGVITEIPENELLYLK